jgi:hypothetical protein
VDLTVLNVLSRTAVKQITAAGDGDCLQATAKARAAAKTTKYHQKLDDHTLGAVVETTGALGPEFVKLLRRAASHAAANGISLPPNLTWATRDFLTLWRQRLGISLARYSFEMRQTMFRRITESEAKQSVMPRAASFSRSTTSFSRAQVSRFQTSGITHVSEAQQTTSVAGQSMQSD